MHRASKSPYWITAKGQRALGLPVPQNIPDDDVIILVPDDEQPAKAS